jgi:hypothetical protein
MDTFCGGERRSRHTTRIELYPKGYLPPSLISLRRGKLLTAPPMLPARADEFIE